MKYLFIAASFLAVVSSACSQTQPSADFNLNIDNIDPKSALPYRWFKWGMPTYSSQVDSLEKYEGRYSIKIQPSPERKKKEFGCPTVSIPVTFSGKELELSAYLKLSEVENGYAGLLLRIDDYENTLQFNNMQKEDIHGTLDWKKYTIKLPLDKSAKTIFIGALHTGTGTVWADDFCLKVDGKDISKETLTPLVTYKADEDHAFDKGSGISLANLQADQIRNLNLLGQIWGFLKYYHPNIAAGNINWDYELFRFLPAYLNVKNQKERNEHLLNLVKTCGAISEISLHKKVIEKDAKMKPALAWIDDAKELGSELSSALIAIKNNKREGEHYYIKGTENVGNPIFTNERSYKSMPYPDDAFRLLSLYRYWNMVNYFFPYKYLIKEKWEDVLTEFIPVFINAANETDYTLAALKLIARIHDTHAGVWAGNKALNQFKGSRSLPFQARFIEDKLVVTGFYVDTLGIKNQVAIGDIITKINGKPIQELIEFYKPLCPASNYEMVLRDLPGHYLLRSNNDKIKVEVIKDDKPVELDSPTIDRNKLNFKIDYAWNADAPEHYLIKENIGYLLPSKYKNNHLPEIKKQFESTKGIIIDMRCYPSDFMPFFFGGYLKSKASEFVKFTIADYKNPGFFEFSSTLANGGKIEKHYDGKLVILVNDKTQSQAEYTTMAFQGRQNVTVIGNRTAGADGNVSHFILPGNIHTAFSGIGIYYPDGAETQQVGVKIDLPMKPTIAGIKAGKDELLEKAIELIERNP